MMGNAFTIVFGIQSPASRLWHEDAPEFSAECGGEHPGPLVLPATAGRREIIFS